MRITITLDEINPENGKSYRMAREFIEEELQLNIRTDFLHDEYLKMKRDFEKRKKEWLLNENHR